MTTPTTLMIPNFHKKILSISIVQSLHQVGFEKFSSTALQTFTDSVIYFIENLLKETNSIQLRFINKGYKKKEEVKGDMKKVINHNFNTKDTKDTKDNFNSIFKNNFNINVKDNFNLKIISQLIINWEDTFQFLKSQIEIKESLVKKIGKDSSIMNLIRMLPDKVEYRKKGVVSLNLPGEEKKVKINVFMSDFIDRMSELDDTSKSLRDFKVLKNEDSNNEHVVSNDEHGDLNNDDSNDEDGDFLNSQWIEIADKKKIFFNPPDKMNLIHSENNRSPYSLNSLIVDDFVDKRFVIDKEGRFMNLNRPKSG